MFGNMLTQEPSCIDSIEICSSTGIEEASIQRPDIGDFMSLTFGYFLQGFTPYLSILVASVFVDFNPNLDLGYFFNLTKLIWYVYAVPFILNFVLVFFDDQDI